MLKRNRQKTKNREIRNVNERASSAVLCVISVSMCKSGSKNDLPAFSSLFVATSVFCVFFCPHRASVRCCWKNRSLACAYYVCVVLCLLGVWAKNKKCVLEMKSVICELVALKNCLLQADFGGNMFSCCGFRVLLVRNTETIVRLLWGWEIFWVVSLGSL